MICFDNDIKKFEFLIDCLSFDKYLFVEIIF
jgi:hypothetical protein